METKVIHECPDGTYFRTGDVEPIINGSIIELTAGEGSRRSWGRPQTNNTIVYQDCDFIAIHTGFSHKHGGGQFWRYFVQLDDGIVRKTWRGLTDDERQIVLDNLNNAPSWAKSPGKLRSEYRRPSAENPAGPAVPGAQDGCHQALAYFVPERHVLLVPPAVCVRHDRPAGRDPGAAFLVSGHAAGVPGPAVFYRPLVLWMDVSGGNIPGRLLAFYQF